MFDGAERPRIEMRAARGGCLLLLRYCSLLFLPTTHDDEIENGQPGEIASAVLALGPNRFPIGRHTSNRRRHPPSLRPFASVFQTERRRFLRDESVAYPVFSSMAGKHAAPALRAGRRLDNTTYSANYVSEYQV